MRSNLKSAARRLKSIKRRAKIQQKSRQVSPVIEQLILNLDPSLLSIAQYKFNMLDSNGQFKPVKNVPDDIKSMIAQGYAYSEWARVALDVANQYESGDYFEFGSEGLNTLCNFLVAFHLNGYDLLKPNVKCFAFDIFGDPRHDDSLTSDEQRYFQAYTKGKNYYREMQLKYESYEIMKGRVELIKGYFKDTLNDDFKKRLRNENRNIGFAFLDCNIPSSYETCFNFMEEFINPKKSFVYLDEYYQFPEVANLYDKFVLNVSERYGLKSRFVRTAGAYGALFRLM